MTEGNNTGENLKSTERKNYFANRLDERPGKEKKINKRKTSILWQGDSKHNRLSTSCEGETVGDLIDTTEMYLKTIYELLEAGVTPMRARIVDRLGHSGPTVSQTIARMERDGLVYVAEDRRLNLTEKGMELATEVVRKHRLAERLLVDVIGLDWKLAHDEACRWEHVMSDAVEERLLQILDSVERDPYGNPIPGAEYVLSDAVSLATLRENQTVSGAVENNLCELTVERIGEPIQADSLVMGALAEMNVRPGRQICVTFERNSADISLGLTETAQRQVAILPQDLEAHFFVKR